MVDPNTRQGKRTPVTLKIKFKSETLEQFIERYAVDVSQGGIFIRTKEPLAVGTQMRFEFQLRDASPLIAGEGTVVWTRENDPSRPAIAPGMGVRFDRLAEGSQTVLERILSEKAKQAPQRPADTTKPPMFTDTPTKVAPAPVQEALLGDSNRPSFGEQHTPLPKPVPFHSDADDFDEQAFEEATKVRAVDELVAQSALSDGGDSSAVPKPSAAAASKPTTIPPASKPNETFKPADEPRRISNKMEIPPEAFDRDSAPNLPSPPSPGDSGKQPRLLDTSPSPRTESPSTPPPIADPTKTKLGVEPARPVAAASVNRPVSRSMPTPVEDDDTDYPVKRSSGVPMVILVLFILAAAAAGIWFFVLRDKAKPAEVVTTPSGSALATGPGSDGSGSAGSAGAIDPNPGSGSGSAGSADPGSAGSGSQMATGPGSAAEPPKGPTVETVIAANADKATVEIAGTDQKGPAPFTAKLEKDKTYSVTVSAPGFASTTMDIKGGAAKQTAKLVAKAKRVEVTSTPDGGPIWIDGRMTGKVTPATVEIPKAGKTVRVSIRKAGFKPVEKVLGANAFTEEGDVMTAKFEATLEKQAAVVRPPQGSGSAGSAAGSGGGTEGSGSAGGGGGSGTTPPPPPPPPEEPQPNP